MEKFRQKLFHNTDLYPDLANSHRQPTVISIGSTSSSSSAPDSPPSTRRPRGAIVISSDEEDEAEIQPSKQIPSRPLSDASNQHGIKGIFLQRPKFPSKALSPNQMIPGAFDNESPNDENLHVPDFPEDYRYVSPAEADQALKDLFSGAMNDDVDVELDMNEATVKGFRPEIKLLPHQIIGRSWMREREDADKKRFGGILADDMGLGKTIQTLTRITEGRPKKQDREDGWHAPTLIVCPLSVHGQWVDEINKMTQDLVVVKHQGQGRTPSPTTLRQAHIVVTTYDTLKSEYNTFNPEVKEPKKKKGKQKAGSDSDDSSDAPTVSKSKSKKLAPKKEALFHVKWFRVVLDEAHTIKNRKTQVAKACFGLEAKYRWCLTGTPMQNEVAEVFSLIHFLRIKPYSRWERFNEDIAKHIKAGTGTNRAMKRLQVILRVIMLRRKKDQVLNGKALIELPKRTVQVISCPFNASENAFYDALSERMGNELDTLLKKDGSSSYMGVLLLLLRLRQACNHPILVSKDYKHDVEAVAPSASKKHDVDKELDPDDLASALGQLAVTRKCKMCTAELHSKNSDEGNDYCRTCSPLAAQALEQSHTPPDSAKIRTILKLLDDTAARDSDEKTIIFSQFTSMLDLIEPFLKDSGYKFVRYDGTMVAQKREESLQRIRTDPKIKIILISFKAGSTGLNLTACNNVILVDLWWNPALEDQAFDRAHRFGQKRDVNIYKLKVDDTVEDRILELQERKRELARAALSGDKAKNFARMGLEEMIGLFTRGHGQEEERD